MTSKEIRAARAALITSTRETFDAIKTPTAEDNAAFDAAMNRADEMLAQAERSEKAAALDAGLAAQLAQRASETGLSLDNTAYNAAREKRVMVALLSGRDDRLPADERALVAERRAGFQAAANTGTNTAGGYTIAPEFMKELLIAMKAQGGMREAARVIPTETGVAMPWPTMDDRSQVATIIAENTQITADTDLVFGSNTLNSFTYKSGVLLVSLQMLQDSAFDFDSLVRDAIAGRFVRGQNAHFTSGTGTGQPQGVLVGAPVGVTAATGGTVTVTFDNVLDLIHSVDPVYRPGSRFMFNDKTLQALRKIKDTNGRYLWQPFDTGTAGAPPADSIWGYPVSINQDMPVMAANALSIAFGNFNSYIIRDVLGMQMMVLRERYADFLQVGYIAYMRTDGRLITAAQPIQTFKNSAT